MRVYYLAEERNLQLIFNVNKRIQFYATYTFVLMAHNNMVAYYVNIFSF